MTVSARQNGQPAAPLPALRTDLVIERRPGGLVHVAVPGAKQGFLMYEMELALARLLDGRHTREDVLAGAGRLGVAATPDSLEAFFRQLRQYGFLANLPVEKAEWRTVSNPEAHARRDPVLKLWSEQRYEEALSYLEMMVSENPEDEGLLQLHEMLQRHLLSEEGQKQLAAAAAAKSEPIVIPAGASPIVPAPSAPAPAPPPAPPPASESDLLSEVVEQGPEERARRRRRSLVRRLLGSAATLGLVAAMLLVRCTDRITEPCELVPKARGTVRSSADAVISEVLVEEGQKVKKGDLLVKLSDFEARKRLDRIDAELARAKAERELLLKGARPTEVRRARQLVAARYREAKLAEARKARLQGLADQQLASAEELDGAISDLAVKESAYAEARANLSLLTEGARPEELAKRDAELKTIEVERALALPQLAASDLKSPIDGVVITPKLKQKSGSTVAAGATVVEVADLSTMVAEVYVPQAKVDLLKVGAPVRLKVANFPQRLFTGKVTFIGFTVEKRGEPPAEFVRAESEIDNREGLLRPSVTGYAEIEAGSGSLGELLFRGVLRWLRYRFVI